MLVARNIVALLVSLLAHFILLSVIAFPVSSESSESRVYLAVISPVEAAVPEVEDVLTPEPQIPVSSIQEPSADVEQPVESASEPVTEPENNQNEITQDFEQSVTTETVAENPVSEGQIIDNPILNEQGGNDGNSEGPADPGENGVNQETENPAGSDVGNDEEPTSVIDLDSILNDYRIRILSEISQHKEYPAICRRMGQEGSVVVRFDVSVTGEVSNIELADSCGILALDFAATDAVEAASPVSPVPEELNADTLTLSLTITFELD